MDAGGSPFGSSPTSSPLQRTPGPIAVNSATFVGYRLAGVLGGIVATLGVSNSVSCHYAGPGYAGRRFENSTGHSAGSRAYDRRLPG